MTATGPEGAHGSFSLPRPAPRRPISTRVRDWVTWFGASRLVVVTLAVLGVGAGGFWLLRAPPPPVEAGLPMAVTSSVAVGTSVPSGSAVTVGPSDSPTSTMAPTELLVHVAGAVARPGVYRLSPGARVVDAVAAAGGLTADADGDAINQAESLRDGDRVYVPRIDEVASVPIGVTSGDLPADGGSGAGPTTPAGPIDLNTADVDQLDELPGVGPATAAAIVAYRTAHGPFASVDDLAEVRGIGPAKLEALRNSVTT